MTIELFIAEFILSLAACVMSFLDFKGITRKVLLTFSAICAVASFVLCIMFEFSTLTFIFTLGTMVTVLINFVKTYVYNSKPFCPVFLLIILTIGNIISPALPPEPTGEFARTETRVIELKLQNDEQTIMWELGEKPYILVIDTYNKARNSYTGLPLDDEVCVSTEYKFYIPGSDEPYVLK